MLLGFTIRLKEFRASVPEEQFGSRTEVFRGSDDLYVANKGALTVGYAGVIDVGDERPDPASMKGGVLLVALLLFAFV